MDLEALAGCRVAGVVNVGTGELYAVRCDDSDLFVLAIAAEEHPPPRSAS